MIRKLRDCMMAVAGWALSVGLLVTVLLCCWGCQFVGWVYKAVGRVLGYGEGKDL